MALGAIMFSLPAAVLGSYYVSVLNGFDATQGLVAYSVFGMVFLLGTMLANGLARD